MRIGRLILKNDKLIEGDNGNSVYGFKRIIWKDGSYYNGALKNNKKHGKGCFVSANGVVSDGNWAQDEFIGLN